METPYDYNFIIELDENNKWLIDKIKDEDRKTYELLIKTKANVFTLIFKGMVDLAQELILKYKALLISAYPYYLAKCEK